MIVKHKPCCHFAFPLWNNVIVYFTNIDIHEQEPGKVIISWKFKFDNSVWHEHNEPDDWNKGCGVTFGSANASQDTIMCAWRLKQKQLEFTPYIHLSNRTVVKEDWIFQDVQPDEEFTFSIVFDAHNYKFSCVGEVGLTQLVHHYDFTPEQFKMEASGREVNSWYGGTSKPRKKHQYTKTRPQRSVIYEN
jgi:hypothetical protein